MDFKSDNFGRVKIDEPIGFSSVEFNLNQKEKGFARDISFNGGEAQFEFVDYRNHYLDQLLYYYHIFGFESKVNLIVEKYGVSNIIGELDFAKAESDDLKYFKCKAIQDSSFQIIKRRKDIKIDLLSDRTVDGEYITPLPFKNTLLLAKPFYQSSKWSQPSSFSRLISAQENFLKSLVSLVSIATPSTAYLQINPCQNLVDSGLENSFTWFDAVTITNGSPANSDFLLVTAKDNLKNVKIDIKNLIFNLYTSVSGGGNGYTNFSFKIKYGATFDTATTITLFSDSKRENDFYSFTGDFIQNIPFLDRGASIWIFFDFKVRQSSSIPFSKFNVDLNISNMETSISAESTSYNSITPSFRFIDVIKQVVKSISGLDVSAPRFELLGEFYENRLFNGNFLRGIADSSFYISLEDIENSIVEMNGDYEISSDGSVFFGIEEDFYKPIQSGFFDSTQFFEMNKTFNDKFSINKFTYKYKSFQALKENETANTSDGIHGDSEWVFANKRVENKKEVNVDWIRDAFLIESTRRKSIELSNNTASQDDDKLFCIDTIDVTESMFFDDITKLSHAYNESTYRLSLIGDGTLNFIALGISVGSSFEINGGDNNSGSYIVYDVSSNNLELTKTGNVSIGIAFDGIRITSYKYELTPSVTPFLMRTNEGFTAINNLNSNSVYANLRYSLKRNILNYYGSYLATCNIFKKTETIKNSFYKNNGECSTTYLNDTVVENQNFIPSNPILSPFLYNDIVLANVEFEDYIALQSSVRIDRGYIRTIDNNSNVIKLYPVSMSYENLSKQLTIIGEEKYEPVNMTIVKDNKIITINSETKVLSLTYEIISDKLYIFDEVRQRLYNGVYWDLVSINGASPETLSQLEQWLDLL